MSIDTLGIDDEIVLTTIANINAHYKEKRKFVDIAKMQNIAPDVLTVRFLNQGLETPTHHLKELRKDLAKRLVSDGELSLEEIAKTLGYDKTSNFYVWYLSVFGERPTKVRARMGLKSKRPSLGVVDAVISSIVEKIDLNPYLYKDVNVLINDSVYTTTYIRQKFIELHGVTPRAYLLNKQLEYVAEQIKTHGYKETRLLEMTIYNAPTGLNKAFKAKYGMTTSEFGESKSIGMWAKVHGENVWILPSLMEEIVDNVTENLLENRPHLTELREFYGVNTSSWERMFTLYTGMLPSKARLFIRLEIVVYFLQNTRWKFSKILRKVGSDYEYDIRRHLMANYGLTPAEIRKHKGPLTRRNKTKQFVRFVKTNADLCIREDDIRLGKIKETELCTL
ncbi:transcriptional regulator [Vibrio phage USC-1]|uniref:HTH araC/xylS-type domain-containing protein n=2 Tax=Aphroditevirus USC1 TaxID=2846605 RepID=A0A514A2M4_9CAUD|nr:transcriptional regulator [Vibrio phage USC-1]QCW23192.1 hypothetical protein [Vibrio phage 5 TSL-2019]QDH47537.1 hypothetical protein [Vibrio phage USC-1]